MEMLYERIQRNCNCVNGKRGDDWFTLIDHRITYIVSFWFYVNDRNFRAPFRSRWNTTYHEQFFFNEIVLQIAHSAQEYSALRFNNPIQFNLDNDWNPALHEFMMRMVLMLLRLLAHHKYRVVLMRLQQVVWNGITDNFIYYLTKCYKYTPKNDGLAFFFSPFVHFSIFRIESSTKWIMWI